MATREQLQEWGRKGGKARAQGVDMKAVGALGGKATHARYGSEQMARAGSLGWQALVAKVGIAGAVERLHAWKLAHPSSLELAVQQVLADLGYAPGAEDRDYERDGRVIETPPIYGDFVFPAERY